MKVLIISNKSPYPPREGGPIAMNMIVEGLLEKGHEVKVLAVNSFKYNIREEDIPEEYRKKTGIELIDVDLRIKPLPAFLNLFTGRSYHVERFISSRFRQRLTEVLKGDRFDIVQMETIFVAPYLETVRIHSKARVVLRAHNIEHLIWARVSDSTSNPLKRWYLRHLATTLKRYEHKMLPRFDGIAAITEKDADYFRETGGQADRRTGGQADRRTGGHVEARHASPHLADQRTSGPADDRIVAIPFGIDLDNFPPPVTAPEPVTLFTIGAMNWMPNAEGVKWFLQHVWPEVHKEFPSLTYFLAGREMPDWMARISMPNVKVVGEVPDAREFVDAHGIMIVPLFSGSGIRIKIIEGMAAGRPVLSTPIGAEGIDCTHGKNILIANTPCEFTEMIALCMADRDRCKKLGADARKLVESDYDRRLIMEKLITFYQHLAG